MTLEVKLTILIELDDDDCGEPTPGNPLETRMLDAAREAVKNALTMGEEGGFSHDMSTTASVSVIKVGAPIRSA